MTFAQFVRAAVLLLGILAVVAGLLLITGGLRLVPVGLVLLVVGSALVLVTLLERASYGRRDGTP